MRDTLAIRQCAVNCTSVLRHYRLPVPCIVATLCDRTLFERTRQFLGAFEPLVPGSFESWAFNRNHGTSAIRGWRERVARYSMQIVEHGHGILEADFDLWNPNHGILPTAGHLAECLWPGKTDPFRILRGLRGRGIKVRDVRQGEENGQCDSYFG
jgi:hypothetical protein